MRRPNRTRRPSSNTPTRSRCSSPSCCRRRRPMPASTRRRRRCSPAPTRRRRWSRSARTTAHRAHPTIGLFRTKAKNVIALSRMLVDEHGGEVPRDRARRSRRCRASGARPPTSCSTSPSASRRSRSTPTSSGSPTAPASRPGKTPLEVETGPRADRAGRVQAPRPPLADPARALRLHRAEAEMPGLPDRRHLPLPRQDAAAIALAHPSYSAPLRPSLPATS